MGVGNDSRIDAFRDLLEQADRLHGQLQVLEAASQLITDAAGGRPGLITYPLARWHHLELNHHRSDPSVRATQAAHLAHLRDVWSAINFAVASVRQIEVEAQEMSDGHGAGSFENLRDALIPLAEIAEEFE